MKGERVKNEYSETANDEVRVTRFCHFTLRLSNIK